MSDKNKYHIVPNEDQKTFGLQAYDPDVHADDSSLWDNINDIKTIQTRLDVPNAEVVNLEPGYQVIDRNRDVPFDLTGIKGFGLMNMLGSSNEVNLFQTVSPQSKISYDNGVYTLEPTGGVPASNVFSFTPEAVSQGNVWYIVAGSLLNTRGRSYMKAYERRSNGAMSAETSGPIYARGNWNESYFIFKSKSTTTTIEIQTYVMNANNAEVDSNVKVQFKDMRMYRLSDSEAARIQNMTPADVLALYPYTPAISPVKNPYVVQTSGNLLPPFTEWVSTGHPVVYTDEYVCSGTLVEEFIGTDVYLHVPMKTKPGQTYTLNPGNSTANMRVSFYDTDGMRLQTIFVNSFTFKTFSAPENAVSMSVAMSGVLVYDDQDDPGTWEYSAGTALLFTRPMLTYGTTNQPFSVQKRSHLYMNVDLYANPRSKLDQDEIKVINGEVSKLKQWEHRKLDNKLSYRTVATMSPFKVIGVRGLPEARSYVAYGMEPSGRPMTVSPTMNTTEPVSYFRTADLTDYNFSVHSSFSGWADSYTPSEDEIKAFMNGYQMSSSSSGYPAYEGTGTKYWVGILSRTATTTLPTGVDTGWNHYQVLYLLKKPIIEAVQSEGQLSLSAGSNMVVVGSGLILREEATLTGGASTFFNINKDTAAGLKYPARAIRHIYRNGNIDKTWWVSNPTGIRSVATSFDKEIDVADEVFTVSYETIRLYPRVQFTGSVPVSEQSLINHQIDATSAIMTRLNKLEDFFGEAAGKGVIKGKGKISGTFVNDTQKGDLVQIRTPEVGISGSAFEITGTTAPVVQVSPDGDYVARSTGSLAPYLRMFRRVNGSWTELPSMSSEVFSSQVRSLSFSGDGTYLVIGCSASPYISVCKRNASTGIYEKLANVNIPPSTTVLSVSFSPIGNYFAASMGSGGLILYKGINDSFTKLADPDQKPSTGAGVSFSYDGKYLLAFGGSEIYVYLQTGDTFTALVTASPPGTAINKANFTFDAKYIVMSMSVAPNTRYYQILPNNSIDLVVPPFTASRSTEITNHPSGLTFLTGPVEPNFSIIRSSNNEMTLLDAIMKPLIVNGSISTNAVSRNGKVLVVHAATTTYVYDLINVQSNAFTKIDSASILDELVYSEGMGYALEDGVAGETKSVMRIL